MRLRHLLLVALALAACGPERSSTVLRTDESATSDVVASLAPACNVELCAASAGPCQVAGCDESSGLCRTSAAREGEQCLPGNACGPARCGQGRCEPENPPLCRELTDACNDARCDPERGCVSQPRDLAGSRCDHPAELVPRGITSATSPDSCGQPARGLPGCWEASAGSSVYFELDLRAAPEALPVTLVIDGGFEFEAALTRGPCDDPVLVQCAQPYYADGRARALTVTLQPDRYQLVVQAVRGGERGRVQVAASAGGPECARAPSNDSCGAALELDTSLDRQSVLGSMACARADVPVYCTRAEAADVFYALDLSDRTSETLLDVELAENVVSLFAVSGAGAAGSCGELLLCGPGFSRKLPPGTYELGVSRGPYSSSDPFALAVGLGAPDCAQSSNTSWQTAFELDPTLERQRLQGNTACGKNQLTSACNDDRGAPELYYRLDLRGQAAPRTVRLQGNNRASGLLAYVLHPSAAEDASPSALTACAAPSVPGHSLSFVTYLAPRLYYLVIDGQVRSQGRFDLELSLSEMPIVLPAPCLDYWIGRCLSDTEPACAASPAAPACLAAAVPCGLQPQLYEEFCRQWPGCCDGSADRERCAESWQAVAGCR